MCAKKRFILSYDIGTREVKACLVDVGGTLISKACDKYQGISHPYLTWAEQEPEMVWKAYISATRKILDETHINPAHIVCLSFDGNYESCVAIDRNVNVLRPCIMWYDVRSIAQAERIKKKIGEDAVCEITGPETTGPIIFPFYMGPKILWIRDNEPKIFNKTFKFLTTKSYVIAKLTGRFVTDTDIALGTLLYNPATKSWSKRLCDSLNIPIQKLPELHSPSEVIGEITQDAAKKTGLSEGTPVVVGTGDWAAAQAGMTRIERKRGWLWIGSSASIYIRMPSGRIFHGTQVQCAGATYNWLREEIFQVESFKTMDGEAEKAEPNAGKLIFLPYMMGEQAQVMSPYARGALFGLTLYHKRKHIIRSVLEGVAFNLRTVFDFALKKGAKVDSFYAGGGGAKSSVWMEIIANTFNRKIVVPKSPEYLSSLGAALIGGVGVGEYPNLETAPRLEAYKIARVYKPTPQLVEIYRRHYEKYKEVSRVLLPLFKKRPYFSQ